jgi:hypothetical protein
LKLKNAHLKRRALVNTNNENLFIFKYAELPLGGSEIHYITFYKYFLFIGRIYRTEGVIAVEFTEHYR